MSLTITKVEVLSELPVSNSNGYVNSRHIISQVWAPDNFNIDGQTGSMTPVGLILPSNPLQRYQIPMRITARCTFPANYPREADCKVVGTVANIALESESFHVSLPSAGVAWQPDIPWPPHFATLTVANFSMAAPFPNSTCPVPFRIAGDVEWKVVVVSQVLPPAINQDIPGTPKTRLELYWLRKPAPAGPLLSHSMWFKTKIDMQGVFPVDLLRLFLPDPSKFIGRNNFDLEFDQWWVNHVIAKVRTGAFLYDAIAGKSAFGVGTCGGSFDFQACLQTCFGPGRSSAPTLVNSFDMCALVQLGCTLLLNDPAIDVPSEVLDSYWVCKTPYGFPKPSMPIGIEAHNVPPVNWARGGVNNTFYRGMGSLNSTAPFIEFIDRTNRAFMVQNRVWLEVALYDPQLNRKEKRVLDATFSVPSDNNGLLGVDYGARSREAYATAHIHDPVGYLGGVWDDFENDPGQCYLNNSFSTRQTGVINDNPDDSHVARVGVYNLEGVNEPRTGPVPAPFVPIPGKLRDMIVRCICSGKDAANMNFSFNDASLKAMNLRHILMDATLTLPALPWVLQQAASGPDGTDLKVARGVTVATYSFASPPDYQSANARDLVLKISVFDNFHDAYEAMAFELSKYERSVESMAHMYRRQNGGVQYFGNYSLQTPRSLICMHGNLFIELTAGGTNRPDRDSFVLMAMMMEKLDTHLWKHKVRAGGVRRPSLVLTTPPPPPLSEYSKFSLTMKDVDLLAPQMKVTTSNGHAVTLFGSGYTTGPLGPDHSFTFLVFGKPDEKVTIHVAGAHPETFHPGHINFDVEILSANAFA